MQIKMTDGNVIDGKLIKRLGDTVVIESATLGILNLDIKNIKSIESVTADNSQNGNSWFRNIHAPHTYFGPTSFNFRKGEGYYGNILLLINQVGYGFTDNFSISAGGEFFSLLDGRLPSFFYLNPKYSFEVNKNFTLAAGVFILSLNTNFSKDKFTTTPIPYAMTTIGNRNNNLSLGVGSLFTNGSNKNILILSGQGRLTRGISLMTENYFGGGLDFGTSGFRFMQHDFTSNLGLLYGFNNTNLLRNTSNRFGPFFPIPFLGASIPFGKGIK